MKKISKVAALLAASALLFGGLFLSCSDSDDDGNATQVSGPSSNSGSGNSGSGNSGDSGSGNNGGSGNQEGGSEEDDSTAYPNSLVYNFDDLTTTPNTAVGDNSILDGKVVYWVSEGKTGNAKVVANSEGTHHYLQVGAGGAIDSALKTIDLSAQTTLLKLKAAQVGKEQIIFTFTTVKGSADSNNRILVVDPASGAVLGQTSEVSCGTSDDNTEKTLSVKAEVPETFYLVFARSAGKGGFKFTKIEQKYRQESGSGSGSEGGSTGGSGESGSSEQGGSESGSGSTGGSSESGSGEQGGSGSGSGEQSNTSTTYTLVMGEDTVTIVAKADSTYTASIGENVVETGTYKVSEDGKTVTTTSAKGVTSYTIGDNNVLTVVGAGPVSESGSGEQGGSGSGSGEQSNTSTTYTLSIDGATITIVAKADGTYTASTDGAEVESGTYTLSADGKTVTTTSAKGATSYTIGDNNVLTVVESDEGEQVTTELVVFDGSTMTAITDLPSYVTRIDTNSKQSVDANSKSLNGKSFSNRFKFGGKDSDTHSANALKIATGSTSDVKVIVYAMSSSSSKTGTVKAAGTTAVTLLTNGGTELLASEEVSVTPDSDGNIYIYAADQAMNIYYLVVKK